MKRIFISFFTTLTIFITGCGDTSITIGPGSYEPKIVIDGYIFPGQTVYNIRIMRNNPVNGTLDHEHLAIDSAQVSVTDLQTGTVYPLRYNKYSASYEHDSTDLIIGYNKNYRLDVQAEIDGVSLSASCTTTTPDSGFHILDAESVTDSLRYRMRDSSDDLMNFLLRFQRSPQTDFYAISIFSLEADTSTFIYYPANPAGNVSRNDVQVALENYRHIMNYENNTPLTVGISERTIDWADLWFYGRYQVIVYAADRNYRDFCLSFDNIEEQDGNYHEPVFHIQGDGIGVFSAMIPDTAYINVLR